VEQGNDSMQASNQESQAFYARKWFVEMVKFINEYQPTK